MKKIISVFFLINLLALSGMAQHGPQPLGSGGENQPRPGAAQNKGGGGSLELMKIGFITKRLNLTPDEAQKFWPIYYQYAGEIRQAHQAYAKHHNEIGLEEALLNIKKRYSGEFEKALSPERVNEFFRAEKDFGAYVQKEQQRRQMQNTPQRKPLAGE